VKRGAGRQANCRRGADDELRLKQKYHYIIFKIQNKIEVVIDAFKPSEEKFDFSEFHKTVSSINEPRFIALDYHYTLEDTRHLEKIVFITWSPDKGAVAPKMLYAAAKEDFKKRLQGVHKALQATDQSELDEKAILAVLNAK